MEFELSRNKEQEKILGILYQALVLIDLKQELFSSKKNCNFPKF